MILELWHKKHTCSLCPWGK